MLYEIVCAYGNVTNTFSLSTVMPRQILAQDILIKDVQSLSTVLYVEENAEVMTVDFLLAWGESESLVSGHHHQGLLPIHAFRCMSMEKNTVTDTVIYMISYDLLRSLTRQVFRLTRKMQLEKCKPNFDTHPFRI